MAELDHNKIEKLKQEALDWVLHLKTGTPTDQDIADCQAWRARSPEHEESFREAALLWRQLTQAARELKEEEEAETSRVPAAHVVHAFRGHLLGRRALLGGAIAASVASYLVVRPPFGLWPSLAELTAEYRTATGEQRRVDLGHGASVEMNTQTSLRVNALQDTLEIDLISGEALVDASPASNRLLILKALDGRVSSRDARFNVRCLDGEVYVTCLQGKVNVEQHQHQIVLNADEEVSYSESAIGASTQINATDVTSWQSRILVFRNRPLYDVVKEINRYLPGKIVVTNAALGHKVVNGTFHVDHLQDVIGQIQHLFSARVISLPGGITFLS